MANVGVSSMKLIDSDGDALDDGAGRLNVNATIGIGSSTLTSYPQFDVGTSAIQLSSSDGINSTVTTCKEIIIQPDFDNAGFVMVGDSGVSTNDTEGVRLSAGETLILPISSTANVYFRASASSQNINVVIIT